MNKTIDKNLVTIYNDKDGFHIKTDQSHIPREVAEQIVNEAVEHAIDLIDINEATKRAILETKHLKEQRRYLICVIIALTIINIVAFITR